MELDDGEANVEDQVAEIDRISALPDHLAHYIMSLLPVKDLTKTSVLSKKWEHLWLTYPVVEFDEIWFYAMQDTATLCRTMFLQYLRQSLSRREFNHMQKLRISTVFPHDYDLDHLVNRCVASGILRGKVQQLHLRIKNPFNPLVCDHYVLPRVIFSSASSLVTLILEDSRCGVYNKISFPSLKNLTLRCVHVSNRVIYKTISNSPRVETLRLEFCDGFDTLKVFNPKLRCLIVIGCKELVAFEMDAPRLNYFRCNGIRRVLRGNPNNDCSEISKFKVSNVRSLSSLATLVLSFVKMNNDTFRSMLSSFPNLENMELLCSLFVKIPSIIFGKLKFVEMQNCHFNELVEFSAPDLKTLAHRGGQRRCILSHFCGMGFRSLKILSLVGYFSLTDKSLGELLSSCIVLEDLNLKSCGMLEHLKVTSSTLKNLIVHSCPTLVDGEIQAANLVFFQYAGKQVQFSSISTSLDLDAELHFENPYYDIGYLQLIESKKLLRNFNQARVLTIVSNCTEYVVFPEEAASQVVLPHLKVKSRFVDRSFLNILLGVLRISFCHETLWINVGNSTLELKFQEINEEDIEIDFSLDELELHDCIQQHLTEVKLENFDGCDEQMELVTYLLQKAQLLKSLFISFSEELTKAPSDLAGFVSQIINYPKASHSAHISFI